jgi:hypothetical protein
LDWAIEQQKRLSGFVHLSSLLYSPFHAPRKKNKAEARTGRRVNQGERASTEKERGMKDEGYNKGDVGRRVETTGEGGGGYLPSKACHYCSGWLTC